MEAWIKVAAGFGFLIVSLGFLYRPAWVLKWNALARAIIFNDSHVLHSRRRFGLLLFLGAIIFFYSGFQNMAHNLAAERPSDYLALLDAQRSFRAQHYRGAIVRCQEILKRDGENVHAWALLGSSWAALGRKDQARRAWEELLRRDPEHPAGRSALFHAGADR